VIENAIKVKILTEENFEPYGQLVKKPLNNPLVAEEKYKWWNYSIIAEETVSTGILQVNYREFYIDKVEKHIKTSELLVPLAGDSFIVVGNMIADEVDKIEAFYLSKDQVVIFKPGILHWMPFPLTEEALFLVSFRAQTPQDDMIIIELKKRVKLVL
jgi:ureidoglycolate hydrolase